MRSIGRTRRAEGRKTAGALRALLLLPPALCLLPSPAFAIGRQEEVLRTINQNVGQEFDGSKLLAAALVILALVLLIALVSQRHKRSVVPKAVKNPGKLVKEISRSINLKPAELKQLKTLAETQQLSSPLVLLLCPSLLARAAKESPDLVNRDVLGGLAKKIAPDRTAS
jgi:hypothetical protein